MELKEFYTAKNPNTPPETLAELAKNESLDIRKAVAGNPNTPPEILTKLTKSEGWGVRMAVAKNPNTPPETLAELSKDEDVCMAVANNPNTPPETLAELAKDEIWVSRMVIAKNPNTPPETLAELAKDEELYVRTEATENPNYITLVKEVEIASLSNLLDEDESDVNEDTIPHVHKEPEELSAEKQDANRVESESKHNISSVDDDYVR